MDRFYGTKSARPFCAGATPMSAPGGRRFARLTAAVALTAGIWVATPVQADPFVFSTGTPDGLLGSLSQPASGGHLETETADDFMLTNTTSIAQATIAGLLPSGTPLANISNVEVEIYHVFPTDSTDPPSGHVTARKNSPADVEIGSATRDGSQNTLSFTASQLNASFAVANTVVDGINQMPASTTEGEGSASGEAVQISITFTPPIVLPADHYFFRPEVEVTGGDFLYLSAPKPIAAGGTPFMADLQAWVRNSDLQPDWLRIGTDIIGGATPPTFNMTFSLNGETQADAPTPTSTSQPTTTSTPQPTATSIPPPTATSTSQPTVTATVRPRHHGGGGCSIDTAPPLGIGTLLILLAPAVLWWCTRRTMRVKRGR